LNSGGADPRAWPGQALTRTIYVSLDPYQWGYKKRGRRAAGTACHARTVSQVVESNIEGLAPGDFVFNTNGWAEYGLMGAGVARPTYMIPESSTPPRAVSPRRSASWDAGPHRLRRHGPAVIRSPARPPGLGGLRRVGRSRASSRPQAPRRRHRRPSREVPLVTEELGFDACVSHLTRPSPPTSRTGLPKGVDVYFENVRRRGVRSRPAALHRETPA